MPLKYTCRLIWKLTSNICFHFSGSVLIYKADILSSAAMQTLQFVLRLQLCLLLRLKFYHRTQYEFVLRRIARYICVFDDILLMLLNELIWLSIIWIVVMVLLINNSDVFSRMKHLIWREFGWCFISILYCVFPQCTHVCVFLPVSDL